MVAWMLMPGDSNRDTRQPTSILLYHGVPTKAHNRPRTLAGATGTTPRIPRFVDRSPPRPSPRRGILARLAHDRPPGLVGDGKPAEHLGADRRDAAAGGRVRPTSA